MPPSLSAETQSGLVMYGLFLRALQGHVDTTFGPAAWGAVLSAAGIRAAGFEPLISYGAPLFRRVIAAAGQVLDRPVGSLLEDVGNFVVTNPAQPAARRLLRFGGAGFGDFLLSLEELPDRARLALPDVDFPRLQLCDRGGGDYLLAWQAEVPELAYLLLGILRSLADDYGALVMIEVEMAEGDRAALAIRLLEAQFAAGNRFDLSSVA